MLFSTLPLGTVTYVIPVFLVCTNCIMMIPFFCLCLKNQFNSICQTICIGPKSDREGERLFSITIRLIELIYTL